MNDEKNEDNVRTKINCSCGQETEIDIPIKLFRGTKKIILPCSGRKCQKRYWIYLTGEVEPVDESKLGIKSYPFPV